MVVYYRSEIGFLTKILTPAKCVQNIEYSINRWNLEVNVYSLVILKERMIHYKNMF